MRVSRRLAARVTLYTAAIFLAAALSAPVLRTMAAQGPDAGFSEDDGLGLSGDPPQKVALLGILYNASTYGELHPCPT